MYIYNYIYTVNIFVFTGLSYVFLAVKWFVGSMEIHLMAPVWISLCFAEQCFQTIIDISGTCIYPKYIVYNYNTSSRYNNWYNNYLRVANVTCNLYISCDIFSWFELLVVFPENHTTWRSNAFTAPQSPDLQRWDPSWNTLLSWHHHWTYLWNRHGACPRK